MSDVDQPRLFGKDDPGPMDAIHFTRLREEIGTQEEVAEELRINRRTLGRYERGERKVPHPVAMLLSDRVKAARQRKARTMRAAAAIVGDKATLA